MELADKEISKATEKYNKEIIIGLNIATAGLIYLFGVPVWKLSTGQGLDLAKPIDRIVDTLVGREKAPIENADNLIKKHRLLYVLYDSTILGVYGTEKPDKVFETFDDGSVMSAGILRANTYININRKTIRSSLHPLDLVMVKRYFQDPVVDVIRDPIPFIINTGKHDKNNAKVTLNTFGFATINNDDMTITMSRTNFDIIINNGGKITRDVLSRFPEFNWIARFVSLAKYNPTEKEWIWVSI